MKSAEEALKSLLHLRSEMQANLAFDGYIHTVISVYPRSDKTQEDNDVQWFAVTFSFSLNSSFFKCTSIDFYMNVYHLCSEKSQLKVAYADGNIDFSCMYSEREKKQPSIELYHIFVEEHLRRIGHGTYLWDLLVDIAKRIDAECIEGKVDPDTPIGLENLLRFYRKRKCRLMGRGLAWSFNYVLPNPMNLSPKKT